MQYILDNWIALSGIAGIIFSFGLTFNRIKNMEINTESKMKELEKDYDEKISSLFKENANNSAKIDAVKDETYKAITAIQLDIREIMTILKAK